MNLSDFSYNLPEELIAQSPAERRDHSRLLVYKKESGDIFHRNFFDIIEYLNPGDILFLNNSKVFSARLRSKKESGGQVEIFLLKNIDREKNKWQCLLGGRIKESQSLFLDKGVIAQVEKNEDGIWVLSFNKDYDEFMKLIEEVGETPLPPYIKREEIDLADKNKYQTVYASDEKVGSAAAPTAGLHFTKELLKEISKKGVEVLEGTLHVGLGTFLPVKTERVEEHKMHEEEVEIEIETINKLIEAKKSGRRIIAVGTTSVRILESLYYFNIINDSGLIDKNNLTKSSIKFSTNIFIYPGYDFKMVDGLITNFHLPKSSLLLLISALIGRENVLSTYEVAISQKYRFFSYGDAMLII